MKQECFFKNAQWVSPIEEKNSFFVLRSKFSATVGDKATLYAIGLGFFKCYINGKCINPDTFLPLSSEYEASCDPVGERLSGHRIYVPRFDITPFIEDGENVIAMICGGGWYTQKERPFGTPKAIYRISVESPDGVLDYVSDGKCRIGKSYVDQYDLTKHECHNYLDWSDCLHPQFDDGEWQYARITTPLDTEYCQTDCPHDTLIEQLPVTCVQQSKHGIIYDCGKNVTGYPVVDMCAEAGESVEICFSEGLLPDGELDPKQAHSQKFCVVSDGVRRVVQPQFTWYGFRYFKIMGNAKPLAVKVIHADINTSSTFECDNETLNWIYNTFVHTMLCNMHGGHPSDCPHIERRGYTGDGQLTCHAALSVLDARSFYEKWLQDIADGQDEITGHVQYTAPYIRSGGGPGGWGIAIIEVPYQLYKHFGDEEILKKYYLSMRRYIEYLDNHCEFGLLTSDKAGEWCLGDWCGPNILHADKSISSRNQQALIPAPLVNTYFFVRALDKMCEIAEIIGCDGDVDEYKQKATLHKNAITCAYYNMIDGNFLLNAQGANVFAVDIGLGDPRTYRNVLQYYNGVGCLDTGIFATDILIRLLFERGDGDLAVKLLVSDGVHGFERWRKSGETTFCEYWDNNRSRSHNHHMFGAPVAYFFEYLLGIKQTPKSAGYRSLIIEPQIVTEISRMSGSMKNEFGDIAISYQKDNGQIHFKISLPKNTEAILKYADEAVSLCEGENTISF